MGLRNFSYFSTKVQDWKATSYGDIGVSAGYGGGIKHLKLWSQSKKLKVNSLLLHGSAGIELEINSEFLKVVNGVIQNLLKVKDAATAEFNYKQLKCYRSFSIADYIGSTCAGFDESLAGGMGLKVGGLGVYMPGVGPLFSIPPEVENAWGLGGSVTGFTGIIIGVGSQFYDYNMQRRFYMEKNRKATDPVPRPPGGYIM